MLVNSYKMLEKARKLYPDTKFIHLDASGTLNEINETFDMVFSMEAITRLFYIQEHLCILYGIIKNV